MNCAQHAWNIINSHVLVQLIGSCMARVMFVGSHNLAAGREPAALTLAYPYVH